MKRLTRKPCIPQLHCVVFMYYSHYAFVGASSIKSAMEGQQQLYSSDAFAEFSEAVSGNRKLIQTSTVVVLATYE